jgi:glycerophosphoryl diester phosphodiesterase
MRPLQDRAGPASAGPHTNEESPLNPQHLLLSRLALAIACAAAALPASAWNTLDGQAPIVIGHRGASGYRPEHTLESYKLAIEMGANYIEPDLVLTKDGHLIARHEPMLDGTTNVAQVFGANRKSTRMVDGVSTTAYFANDFTLAEIKQIRAIQPNLGRDQQYNNLFEIPTLDEVINLAKQQSALTGRTIGIYPETKHSTFMKGVAQANGFSATYFEDTLVSKLHAAYGNTASAPVFIQSFESANLQYLNTHTNIKLVQLIDANDVNANGSLDLTPPYDRPYDFTESHDPRTFADLLTPEGLAFVKGYADGIGPWKPYLVKTVDDGVERDGIPGLGPGDRRVDGSTGVIEAAHAAGLLVHAYTFRNDSGGYGFANPEEEMAYYFRLGLDGAFTDFPDTGVAALAAAAVPEPQTYALMLGGLALVAGLARRRRG